MTPLRLGLLQLLQFRVKPTGKDLSARLGADGMLYGNAPQWRYTRRFLLYGRQCINQRAWVLEKIIDQDIVVRCRPPQCPKFRHCAKRGRDGGNSKLQGALVHSYSTKCLDKKESRGLSVWRSFQHERASHKKQRSYSLGVYGQQNHHHQVSAHRHRSRLRTTRLSRDAS